MLKKSRVAIFGIGGVGAFAAEALIRAGIGEILLVDNDTITEQNLNRQLTALHSTLGRYKVDVMKERALDINPFAKLNALRIFFDAESLPSFDLVRYNYIVDAMDTVTSKLLLITHANQINVPIVSSMGTGNKLNPTLFRTADIYDTKYCPLARIMRHELKKRNVDSLRVVYSEEIPQKHENTKLGNTDRPIPSSISFVPPVAGMIIAGEVINNLLKGKNHVR